MVYNRNLMLNYSDFLSGLTAVVEMCYALQEGCRTKTYVSLPEPAFLVSLWHNSVRFGSRKGFLFLEREWFFRALTVGVRVCVTKECRIGSVDFSGVVQHIFLRVPEALRKS